MIAMVFSLVFVRRQVPTLHFRRLTSYLEVVRHASIGYKTCEKAYEDIA